MGSTLHPPEFIKGSGTLFSNKGDKKEDKGHKPKKKSTGKLSGKKKETHQKNHPGRGNVPKIPRHIP